LLIARRRIVLPSSGALHDILPKKLRRTDVPDYLLSTTFQRRFGEVFTRRETLLRLSAAAAMIAVPVRPAKALSVEAILAVCKGTIEVGLAGLELLNTYFEVRKHITGQADAQNEQGQSQGGTIVLAIFDEDEELETSEGRRFSIQRHTTAKFVFKNGPAPQGRGTKTFAIASEESADAIDFDVP